MKKIIGDYQKVVNDNKEGKNICFISRGDWRDPEIAYKGILMNYWDVDDHICDHEPTDEDWKDAANGTFDIYMNEAEEADIILEEVEVSDIMNMYRIINLE